MEAEGILNSHLITDVSSDAGDIEALTPNHFLLLRANPSNEEADVSERERSTQQNYGDSLKRLLTSFGSALPRSISLVLPRSISLSLVLAEEVKREDKESEGGRRSACWKTEPASRNMAFG